jgi:7-carboxy-7-deazaguanine synthase
MKFLVSEIFQSIQGEGNYAGVNSLFIRFQLCNLSCKWCDTKFTWTRRSGMFKEFSAEELKSIIQKNKSHHIIFTGGEPALYSIDKLFVPGKKIHVESNATINPLPPLYLTMKDGTVVNRKAMDKIIISKYNWVISPKLKNSGQMLNKEVLKFWASKKYAVFKFIIQNKTDLIEISDLQKKYKINKEKIYICMEGTTLKSQLQPALVEEIIRCGWNFSPRLQVILWGNERKR